MPSLFNQSKISTLVPEQSNKKYTKYWDTKYLILQSSVEALQSPKRPWTNIDFAFNYRKPGDYKQKAKAVLRQKYWRSTSLSWLLFSCPWILFLRSFFAKLFAVINPDMPLIFESLELKWPQYWSFSFGRHYKIFFLRLYLYPFVTTNNGVF